MSNVFNLNAGLWILDTADIISHRKKNDANSGLVATCVRMIRYRPTTSGHSCVFTTLHTGGTPTLAVSVDAYTVTSTERIEDTDTTGAIFTGATAGDWAHVKTSTSGKNLGWWLVTVVDGSKNYIDIEDDTRVLTDESAEYTIDIYTPEICVKLVSETGNTAVKTEVIDFGPNGRWFTNLALATIDSNEVDVYIK